MASNRRPNKAGRYTSDDIYNARRRYARTAKRYEEKARQATGIEASRYRTLARTSLEKAISSYDNPEKSLLQNKKLSALADRLNPRMPGKQIGEKALQKLVNQSKTQATVNIDPEAARQEEANLIMHHSNVGARIYGALSELWEGYEYQYERDRQIMEFFNVDNLADVLDTITEEGIDIYADADEPYNYHDIRTAIQLAFA